MWRNIVKSIKGGVTMQELSAAIKRDRIFVNIFPILMAVVIFFIIKICIKATMIPNQSVGMGICNTLISVWATCLGFMITAVSILLTLNNGKYIDMLKKTGHYKTILISFVSCCFHILIALGIMIVLSILQRWTIGIFALLCASTIDILIIMGICLCFLLVIILKVND
jgi:hypothetical protein